MPLKPRARKKKEARSAATPAVPRGVPRPALRALASLGVTRLSQVTRFTEARLLALHGMGPKAMRIIQGALREQGNSLQPDVRPRARAGRASAPRR